MAGKYVKAVYDFMTSESGEICLSVGDVLEVVHSVDDNWLCGKLHGKIGNFPASFVIPLSLPIVQADQKIFAATRSFPAEVQGDLGFKKGDIIVGLQAVDGNWWQGQKGDVVGILPITHIIELDVPTPARPVSISATPVGGTRVSLPQVNTKPQCGGTIAKVRATMDLTAQLDDELGFYVGDIINVSQIIDADFGIGECKGKTGQFPIAFVEVIEGNLNLNAVKSPPKKSKFRWWEEEDVAIDQVKQVSSQTVYAPASLPASGRNHEANKFSEACPSYAAGSMIGPEVRSTPQEVKTHRRVNSYTQENTRSYDSDVTPYAKTLYPFIAENANELTFFDNEIVNLLRHVDEQWMEGELDGKRGIFPRAYVEIIVDCPHADDMQATPQPVDNVSQSAGLTQNGIEQPHNVRLGESVESTLKREDDTEMYALVLYDFKGESEQSLSLSEGDTVTMLRKLDEHWCEARHDDGRVGLCPLSYVKVIDQEPVDNKMVTAAPSESSSAPPSYASVTNDMKPQSNDLESPGGHPISTSHLPESPPEVIKPARPMLKPKPQLKPKPGCRPKSTSVSPSPPPYSHGAEADPKPLCPPRRAASLDAAVGDTTSSQTTSSQKPAASERKPQPPKPPAFKRASTIDVSLGLDDIIANEMQALKQNTTTETPNKVCDPSIQSTGKATSTSVFYAPVKTPPSEMPQPGGSTSRGRPIPGRPPPPPQANLHFQRQSSGRRAPPRPLGPRAAAAPPRTPLAPTQLDYGPKPVPARPAPARPNPNRPPPPSRGNLMDFSPEKQSPGLTEQDQEELDYLDKRIAEIERDLEKCLQSRQELEHMLTVVEGAERLEAEDNLEFYNANIQGLSQEMQQLKGSIYKIQPERARADAEAAQRAAQAQREAEEERREAETRKQQQEELRQKRREKRERVIAEILKTESDYLQSLSLLLDVFHKPDGPKCAGVDLDTLCGNVDEVMEVSQKLLSQLEGNTCGREFDKQVLGPTFVALKEDMKKVYAPYCRNHDDAIALLEKYEENAAIQEYFTRMMDILRQKITVFDIGSILIKPVQRILKYPLLLNELIKATEEDHIDRQELLNAINAMTDVAATINEYKRRKDLVLKYRTDRDSSLTDKISRLSVHSTKKMLSRITQRMVGTQTVDETFKKEERKFTALDKAVRSLVREVCAFVEQLQEAVGCRESVANDISDYYGEKCGQQEVERFCTVHSIIASNLFHTLKFEVEGEVITPLNRLIMMFAGPAKVIKKRHDKLLDYDNAQGKFKSIKDQEQLKIVQQDLQRTKNNYEALNAQLLDELPRLYSFSVDVVMECIARLVQAQQTYHQMALQQMYQLSALPLILGSDDSQIIEQFNIAHVAVVETLSSLSFITRAFNPRLEEHRPNKGSRRVSGQGVTMQESDSGASQSESQRVYVSQLYTSDRLFRLVMDATYGQPMDLVAPAGTVVGVIKEGDPMGNKERWFVDNGAIKGFIMKKMLSPYHAASPVAALQPQPESQAQARPLTPSSVSPNPAAPTNLMDLSSPQSPDTPKAATSIPLDLDFTPQAKSTGAELEKPLLTNTSEQTIDWGLPANTELTNQSQHTVDQSEAAAGADDRESSPPPSYTEYAQPNIQGTDSQIMHYRAVYTFAARSPIEASMQEGQLIEVLQQHDLDGNTEWWLIKVDGREGYAPASYLYEVQ